MVVTTSALAGFRRRSHEGIVSRPVPAVFVLDSDAYLSAAVIASWCPAASVQAVDASDPAGLETVRSTVEHAVRRLAVRTVAVCAEGAVRPDWSARSEALLATCHALTEHPALGRLLRSQNVIVEALWFDTAGGDIHRWTASHRRFELLSDVGVARFLDEVCVRAAPPDAHASA